MWNISMKELDDAPGRRFYVMHEGQAATYHEVLESLQSDAAFRQRLNTALAEAPYSAFRWETPQVTKDTQDRPFEFVILDSPGLARRPDEKAFADYYHQAEEDVTVFANLGRDAILVVPTPLADYSAYGHLAAFVRNAPEIQRHALWKAVGEAMIARLSDKPVWLSTAGAGVSWLHMRLDDRPKYYGYQPYRSIN